MLGRYYLIVSMFCMGSTLQSVVNAQAEAPLPPPIVEEIESGLSEEFIPEVTIIRRAEETITEYRVNGRVTMVKIVPNIGYPYYLIDTDGDGLLESSGYELDVNATLNQWLLFSW